MAKDQVRRDFAGQLAAMRGGELNVEATAAFAELVQAVADHKAKGKLTLVLEVEPGDSAGRTVLVVGDVTIKAPRPKGGKAVMFVGDGGTLHRRDPYQGTLPAGDELVEEGADDAE